MANENTTLEIDLKLFLTPVAIIIGALLISIPISFSIYFGLRDAGLGGGGVALAAECDESSPYSNGCLVGYAQEIGIDSNAFKQCLDAKKFDGLVNDELAYGNQIGIQGTPSVYIGENKDTKMTGFSIGSGATLADYERLIELIQNDGIEAAAEDWKQSQLASLSTYETQLRDFYVQQGQSGDALEATVQQGLAQQRSEIENQIRVQDFEYGQGAIKGSSSARVAVMEFSDYECPFCQRYAQGTGLQVDNALVETGQALFVYREFPLESIHPSARKLSIAARCAEDQGGSEKYFAMHDKIFKVQR